VAIFAGAPPTCEFAKRLRARPRKFEEWHGRLAREIVNQVSVTLSGSDGIITCSQY
jgi:hypothetical protein